MESQKLINLLDDTTNRPSKFWTRNYVKIYDESRETYNLSNQLNFKLQWGYSDAYIHVKGTITVPNTGIATAVCNRTK